LPVLPLALPAEPTLPVDPTLGVEFPVEPFGAACAADAARAPV